MSKTPGGQQASDKYVKDQASVKGLGAESATNHKGKDPLEAAVETDAPTSNVGITEINNNSANTQGAFDTSSGLKG